MLPDAFHQVSVWDNIWFGRCCLKNIKTLLISDIWMEMFDFFSVSMLHYESLYISVQDNIWLEEVVWKIQRMLFSAWPSFESE